MGVILSTWVKFLSSTNGIAWNVILGFIGWSLELSCEGLISK